MRYLLKTGVNIINEYYMGIVNIITYVYKNSGLGLGLGLGPQTFGPFVRVVALLSVWRPFCPYAGPFVRVLALLSVYNNL